LIYKVIFYFNEITSARPNKGCGPSSSFAYYQAIEAYFKINENLFYIIAKELDKANRARTL